MSVAQPVARECASARAGRVRARARVCDAAPRLCCRYLIDNSPSGPIPSELGQLSAMSYLCASRPRPAPAAAPPRQPPSSLAFAEPRVRMCGCMCTCSLLICTRACMHLLRTNSELHRSHASPCTHTHPHMCVHAPVCVVSCAQVGVHLHLCV